MTLLSFQNVSVHYGPIEALSAINIDVQENEIVTLLGANGAGKSSLLMSLFGQPRIKSGQILFRNEAIHHLPTHKIIAKGIALSPERRRIFDKLTVTENLLMGAYVIRDKAQIQTSLKDVFDLFPVLFDRKDQRAGTLSGGEQQMLAMGRALMIRPKLFLLDEPSLGLAPQVVSHLLTILKKLNQQGTTMLLVEQNAYAALEIAHRGYVLVNGRVFLSGQAKDLLANKNIQAAYL